MSATDWPWTLPPKGAVLRQVGPLVSPPHHVRGYCDGHVVVRVWSRRWKSWQYRVVQAWEIERGFWEVDND